MKTKQMNCVLESFSNLANGDAAEELYQLASIFAEGKDETVAARIKRIKAQRANSEIENHPSQLKKNITTIRSGLSASGAKTATTDMDLILSLFTGPNTSSANNFIEKIKTDLAAPPVKTLKKSTPKPADPILTNQFSSELTNAVNLPENFTRIYAHLSNAKLVLTPTLHAIANLYLGNKKKYKGRKNAIEEIKKHFEREVRIRAEDKAFGKIAV